jgi:hypothetical protein
MVAIVVVVGFQISWALATGLAALSLSLSL